MSEHDDGLSGYNQLKNPVIFFIFKLSIKLNNISNMSNN